jgi:hypothetical protein
MGHQLRRVHARQYGHLIDGDFGTSLDLTEQLRLPY